MVPTKNQVDFSLKTGYNQYSERGIYEDNEVCLDTYVLQQDMRMRLPKTILSNLNVEKGQTKFDIFLDLKNHDLILRVHTDEQR